MGSLHQRPGKCQGQPELPDTAFNGLEIHPGALNDASALVDGANLARGASETTIAGDLVGDRGGIPGKDAAPSLLPSYGKPNEATPAETPETLCSQSAIPPLLRAYTHVLHFETLRALLRPLHPYFKDAQGYVTGAKGYIHQEGGKPLYIPLVKGAFGSATKKNPYRRYKNARGHGGRTIGELAAVIENQGLIDFRLGCLVFTMPDDVSKQLSQRKGFGREIAWNAYKRTLKKLYRAFNWGEVGSLTNLHPWKTENPLKPHYHFHGTMANYGDVGETAMRKNFGDGMVKKYTYKGKVKHGPVAFSDDELQLVKRLFTAEVVKMCRRNGIKSHYLGVKTNLCEVEREPKKERLLNVYADYVKWAEGDGRPRFIHKINYQKRHYLEDYARYSNENTDCEPPPEWAEGYENRSRPMGWWCRLTKLAGDVKVGGDKISPITGTEMKPMAVISVPALLSDVPDLHYLEMKKGETHSSALSQDDREWLRSVYWDGKDPLAVFTADVLAGQGQKPPPSLEWVPGKGARPVGYEEHEENPDLFTKGDENDG